MGPTRFFNLNNWCPTCGSLVCGLHICTGAKALQDDKPLVRLANEDIERIAERVAELLSPKKRSTEV